MNKRSKGTIEGIVQGVGFRPFIYQLAGRYHLTGYVSNTSAGVDLEVEGPLEQIQAFQEAIPSESPPLAHISAVTWEKISPKRDKHFSIITSKAGSERTTLISPDVCICSQCLSEMMDPLDRRYRYPFINCTNCGPRYTIIKDVPYDRAVTTMNSFSMCSICSEEYDNPNSRRFHAQPNACWDCGPVTALHRNSGESISCDDPVRKATELLTKGHILAIKGLGGFHLAVDAANHRAVVRLRKRKHREEKPLAIMVKDLETALKIAHVNRSEAVLLTSRQRPIVLLKKRRSHGLSPQVAPRNRYVGIMLPYTPLHCLLMEGPYVALVMTSGNMSEEPITIRNGDAFGRLRNIADTFLVHNRDIHLRSDDSVLRVVSHVPRQIRRSRGYVPEPVFLHETMKAMPSVLAVGGELKNTVCVTKENRAFLSQHVGDMENMETLDFFQMTISHLKKILDITPRVIACDQHPDYLSSRYAKDQKGCAMVAIQHHHAHIVGCLAENGVFGPVIGLAMDGTGLGPDGAVWGGEIMVADMVSFVRKAHLDYIPLPGGDAAAREPWRMALVYLHRAFSDELYHLPIPFVRDLDRERAELILQIAEKGIHSPLTSSCGRLFDAVSALLGIRKTIAFEGQAAIELEMRLNNKEKGRYPWQLKPDGKEILIVADDMIRAIVEDLIQGKSAGIISARFHNTLIALFLDVCSRIREETGIREVALSGGVFQNASLLSGLLSTLKKSDFHVYTHAQVPANDGSLSLGQAVCAGMASAGFKGKYEVSYEVRR